MATAFFSRSRPTVAVALHTAERHSAHNDLRACRMRFAYGLRLLRPYARADAYRGLPASCFALPWRAAAIERRSNEFQNDRRCRHNPRQ